jgi:hypothetical protein
VSEAAIPRLGSVPRCIITLPSVKREETKSKLEKEKKERERERETNVKERSKERRNTSALFYFNLCYFCA